MELAEGGTGKVLEADGSPLIDLAAVERHRSEDPGPQTSIAAALLEIPVHARRSKRALDIVGALLALVVFSPIILATAFAVWVHDRGPVLFRQVRVGAEGNEFKMLKFRSMRPDAEEVLRSDLGLYQRYLDNNCKLEAHEDLRLTRIGRFIRATSLDELPQFWNVLRGDMSLVGPRPALPEQDIGHYRDARPGVTGVWQISGRSTLGYAERVKLDRRYIEGWTLWQDLRILASTPIAVLAGRGAH